MAQVAALTTPSSSSHLARVCENGFWLTCMAGGAGAGIKSVCLISALLGGTATVGVLASVAIISFVALAAISTVSICRKLPGKCDKCTTLRNDLTVANDTFAKELVELQAKERSSNIEIDSLKQRLETLQNQHTQLSTESAANNLLLKIKVTLVGSDHRVLLPRYYHVLQRYTANQRKARNRKNRLRYISLNMSSGTFFLFASRYLTTWKIFRMKQHFSKRFKRLANIAAEQASQALISKYVQRLQQHHVAQKEPVAT